MRRGLRRDSAVEEMIDLGTVQFWSILRGGTEEGTMQLMTGLSGQCTSEHNRGGERALLGSIEKGAVQLG
jgi:hypothetical protein